MQKIEETTCQKEGNRNFHVENRRNYMSDKREKKSPRRESQNLHVRQKKLGSPRKEPSISVECKECK